VTKCRCKVTILTLALLGACSGPPRFDRPAPPSIVFAPIPAPTGEFAVGSLLLDVDDPRPIELLPEGLPRVIEAQLWYPAPPGAEGEPMPYLPRRATANAMIADRYWSRSADTIASWLGYSTHATLNALPAPRVGGFPLLLFAPASAMAVSSYNTLLADLASRGFVVIAVAPRVARAQAVRRTAYGGGTDDDDVALRAADIELVLRRFVGSSGTVAAVARRADLTRAGALGHVTGSAVALEVCARAQVVRRCAAVDGIPDDAQVRRGTTRPTLALRSHRADDVTVGPSARDRWLALFTSGDAGGALYRLSGLDAASPTDAPWMMRDIVRTDSDPARMLTLTSSLLAAFFDAPEDSAFAAVDSLAAMQPELRAES